MKLIPHTVNRAVDLRIVRQLCSEEAVRDYSALAREMRIYSDERADLKSKRQEVGAVGFHAFVVMFPACISQLQQNTIFCESSPASSSHQYSIA